MKYKARIKVKVKEGEYRSPVEALQAAKDANPENPPQVERFTRDGIDRKGRLFQVTLYRVLTS